MTRDDDDLDAGVPAEELAVERASAREALRRLHLPAKDLTPDAEPVCDWCGLPFPCPDSLAPP